MTAVLVILGGLLCGAGVWLAVTGLTPTVSPLNRTITYLHRESLVVIGGSRWTGPGRVALRLLGDRRGLSPMLVRTLRLAGRSPELHAVYLVAAGLTGFLAPLLVLVLLSVTGVNPLPLMASTVVAIGGMALGVFMVHVDLQQRAERISIDLRHQLSAYLNVLTMLLAANHGNEGALKLAAEAGDGRLFVELRRRITRPSFSNGLTRLATNGAVAR